MSEAAGLRAQLAACAAEGEALREQLGTVAGEHAACAKVVADKSAMVAKLQQVRELLTAPLSLLTYTRVTHAPLSLLTYSLSSCGRPRLTTKLMCVWLVVRVLCGCLFVGVGLVADVHERHHDGVRCRVSRQLARPLAPADQAPLVSTSQQTWGLGFRV